jgi:hypothetical protein
VKRSQEQRAGSFGRAWRLAALLACVGAAVVVAQPEGQPMSQPNGNAGDQMRPPPGGPESPDRPGKDDVRMGSMDRDSIRQRLERRIKESERIQERLKAAIEKLDSGAPIGQVIREIGGPGRLGGFGGEEIRQGEPRLGGPEGQGSKPRAEEGGERRLSAEDRQRVADFLKERLPEVDSRIEKLRSIDPQAADRLLETLAPKLREAYFTLRRDPEAFDLVKREMEAGLASFDASMNLRMTLGEPGKDPAKVQAARDALRKALEDHFDARLAVQKRRVEALEKELSEMRSRIDDTTTRREEFIDGKMKATEANIAERLKDGPPDRDGAKPERRHKDGEGKDGLDLEPKPKKPGGV